MYNNIITSWFFFRGVLAKSTKHAFPRRIKAAGKFFRISRRNNLMPYARLNIKISSIYVYIVCVCVRVYGYAYIYL